MTEIKKIDLTCPSCGADMSISEDQKMAVCPYCRKKIYFSVENGKLTAKEAEERSYGETRGKLRAEAEAEAAAEQPVCTARQRSSAWTPSPMSRSNFPA